MKDFDVNGLMILFYNLRRNESEKNACNQILNRLLCSKIQCPQTKTYWTIGEWILMHFCVVKPDKKHASSYTVLDSVVTRY